VIDTLSEGRTLSEIYQYQPGWGLPAPDDEQALIELMSSHDEPEVQTEGPPEVAEDGARSGQLASPGTQ